MSKHLNNPHVLMGSRHGQSLLGRYQKRGRATGLGQSMSGGNAGNSLYVVDEELRDQQPQPEKAAGRQSVGSNTVSKTTTRTEGNRADERDRGQGRTEVGGRSRAGKWLHGVTRPWEAQREGRGTCGF